jgi:putative tricarboxylic transport membrane protein
LQTQRADAADPAGIAIAVLLAGLAVVIAWDTAGLSISSTYGVGPKAMPIVIATGLALLAIGNLVGALRHDLPPREPLDATPLLRILGGLAALIAVIGFGGGFIIGTALLFAMTASGFGRKALHLDLLLGLALSTAVYLAFSKLLALSLPAGPLERLL